MIDLVLAKVDDGALIPGDLVDEAALAAELCISRTPVRDAILHLEADGLISRAPRKGAVIFKPDLRDFLSIMEVHAKLEGQAAGLAARRLSVEKGAALERAVLACEAHHADHGNGEPDAYYQLNIAFHGAIGGAAGNAYLFDMMKASARRLMAYYRARYRFTGAIAESAQEHRQIAEAILSGRAREAEDAMSAHVMLDQSTALDLLVAFE